MLLLQIIKQEVNIGITGNILNQLVAIAKIRININFRFSDRLGSNFNETNEFNLHSNRIHDNVSLVNLIFTFEEYFKSVSLQGFLLKNFNDNCLFKKDWVGLLDFFSCSKELLILFNCFKSNFSIFLNIFNKAELTQYFDIFLLNFWDLDCLRILDWTF